MAPNTATNLKVWGNGCSHACHVIEADGHLAVASAAGLGLLVLLIHARRGDSGWVCKGEGTASLTLGLHLWRVQPPFLQHERPWLTVGTGARGLLWNLILYGRVPPLLRR